MDDPFLNYFALFLLFFVIVVMFYGVIAIHDIPYRIAHAEKDLSQQGKVVHVPGVDRDLTGKRLWRKSSMSEVDDGGLKPNPQPLSGR
jgi:hypothetical protein